jgi:hypothetical protein
LRLGRPALVVPVALLLAACTATSTSTRSAMAPRGGRLAVLTANGVYIMDTGGGHRVHVDGLPDTCGQTGDWNLAWSPPGDHLLIDAEGETDTGMEATCSVIALEVVDRDGSGAHDLTVLTPGATVFANGAAWSPDGTRVSVMLVPYRQRRVALYVVPIQGPPIALVSNLRGEGNAITTWSADGTAIAYSAGYCGWTGPHALHADKDIGQTCTEVIPSTGGPPRRVGTFGDALAWGPGPYIAVGDDSIGEGLWNVSPEGGAPRLVGATDGTHVDAVAWSHDGSELAYCAGGEIDVVDPGGQRERSLALGASCVQPGSFPPFAWSPDDSQIAYVYAPTGEPPGELMVTNVDGSGSHRVSLPFKISAVSWGPG